VTRNESSRGPPVVAAQVEKQSIAVADATDGGLVEAG
jgi:hypothetical protein